MATACPANSTEPRQAQHGNQEDPRQLSTLKTFFQITVHPRDAPLAYAWIVTPSLQVRCYKGVQRKAELGAAGCQRGTQNSRLPLLLSPRALQGDGKPTISGACWDGSAPGCQPGAAKICTNFISTDWKRTTPPSVKVTGCTITHFAWQKGISVTQQTKARSDNHVLKFCSFYVSQVKRKTAPLWSVFLGRCFLKQALYFHQ